jgi:hypothetical protein
MEDNDDAHRRAIIVVSTEVSARGQRGPHVHRIILDGSWVPPAPEVVQ